MLTVRPADVTPGRISFEIDGPPGWPSGFAVEGDGLVATRAGDTALVAALPLAMRGREALRVEGGVSERLRASVATIQDVLAVWWPDRMARVPVEVTGDPPPVGARRRWWGGARPPRVAGLVRGDRPSHHLALAADPPDRLYAVDADGGLPQAGAERVTTDLRAVAEGAGFDWASEYRGAALAAVGHLLPVDVVDLPAPFSVHYLFPWGSHSCLDPLWGGDGLEVRHRHADVDWMQELAVVSGPVADVSVCDEPDGPCGRCRGCLLTAAGLRVLDREGAIHGLPAVDVDVLAGLDVSHYAALADAAVLLRHADADPARGAEVADAVRDAVRRLGPEDVEWPDNWFAMLAELGSARR